MLQVEGRIDIERAAGQFGVSTMTIRRDLRELERKRFVTPVKGGAIAAAPTYRRDSVPDERERKVGIARALYGRIMPAGRLYISTGSTTLEFARLLARQEHHTPTVLTGSLPVAAALFRSRCRVILPGGELRSASLDLTGPMAERNLVDYRVEWAVTGCDGALTDYGFYTTDAGLADLEKASIGIAGKVAVVCTADKFGRNALTRFAALDEVDLLVTDSRLPEADRATLAAAGIEVLLIP